MASRMIHTTRVSFRSPVEAWHGAVHLESLLVARLGRCKLEEAQPMPTLSVLLRSHCKGTTHARVHVSSRYTSFGPRQDPAAQSTGTAAAEQTTPERQEVSHKALRKPRLLKLCQKKTNVLAETK